MCVYSQCPLEWQSTDGCSSLCVREIWTICGLPVEWYLAWHPMRSILQFVWLIRTHCLKVSFLLNSCIVPIVLFAGALYNYFVAQPIILNLKWCVSHTSWELVTSINGVPWPDAVEEVVFFILVLLTCRICVSKFVNVLSFSWMNISWFSSLFRTCTSTVIFCFFLFVFLPARLFS